MRPGKSRISRETEKLKQLSLCCYVFPSPLPPVYEGYFSKIQWKLREEGDDSDTDDLVFNENFRGYWSITSRMAPSIKVWRYLAVTNATNQV